MKVRKKLGGALLLGAAAAMCTTSAATANCDSVLIYDNGFPIIVGVVASQVNDPGGLNPAGADDFDIAAPTVIDDIHWYTADDTTGIDYDDAVRVAIYNDLGACAGPDKSSPVSVQTYTNGGNADLTRTIIDPAAATLGAATLDIVRYDLTKINIPLTLPGKYWIELQVVSNGAPTNGQSFWVSSRTVGNGDVIVGCPSFGNADDGNGWTVVNIGGDVDLNFQLTRCVGGGCVWDIDGPAGSPGSPVPDGIVNVFDLLTLLANWNTNGPGADIAANFSIVDVFDLLDLLAKWNFGCPIDGSNDDCEFATLIVGTGSFAVDSAGATPDGPGGCFIGNDVWYCWKSECTGVVSVSTDGNTQLAVYAMGNDCSGVLGPELACVSNLSSASFIADAGQHYKFQVNTGGPGLFFIEDCTPSNDDCVDAVQLFTFDGGNMFMGSLMGFTPDAGLGACDLGTHAGAPNPSANLGLTPGVWFVVVGDGTTLTASTCPDIIPGADGQSDMFAVYCGNSCDNLIEPCLGVQNSSCPTVPNGRNSVTWCTVGGVIYVIYYAMDNNADTPGDYILKLSSNGVTCTPTGVELGCPGIPGHVCAIEGPDDHTNPNGNCQIYDGTGQGAQGIVAATSDINTGFIVADNFSVANSGNLTEICWYGIYLDFGAGLDCSPGFGDNFNLALYLDDGAGVPAAAPFYTENIGDLDLNIERQANGDTIGGAGLAVYEFTATLATAQALTAGTCYWIEIENTGQGACAWLWATAPPGDAYSMQRPAGDPTYANIHQSDFDLSFCIDVALGLGDVTTDCELSDPFGGVICLLTGYFQTPANFSSASTSDDDTNGILGSVLRVADNFQVDGAGQSITGVCWWGIFLQFAGGFSACVTEPPDSSPFNITYYTDDLSGAPSAGLPGAVIGGLFNITPIPAERVDSGFDFLGPVWEWSVGHAAVAVADGEQVWLEVQHDSQVGETCVFLWLNSPGNGDGAAAQDTGSGTYGPIANDFAFRVNVTGITVAPPPPPANDDCASAIAISAGTLAYSTTGASTDGPTDTSGTCNDFGSPQTHEDIWYTFTAGATGTLTVTTCADVHGEAPPNYDTDLVLYTGAGFDCADANLSFIACNDDDPVNPCGASVFSSTIGGVAVTSGDTFVIRVGGWGAGDEGDGVLSVSIAP